MHVGKLSVNVAIVIDPTLRLLVSGSLGFSSPVHRLHSVDDPEITYD